MFLRWPPGVRCFAAARVHGKAEIWRPTMVDGMPAVAQADTRVMSLGHLLNHGKEASRWRIQHVPFWEAFYRRLRELSCQVGLADAVKLLSIFTKIRLVDPELVELAVNTVHGDTEEILDLQQKDLEQAAEALAVMHRPEAMAVLLGVLATRAHRLEVARAKSLLAAAAKVKCHASHDLADALCRGLVERKEVLVSFKAYQRLAKVLAKVSKDLDLLGTPVSFGYDFDFVAGVKWRE
ncbi:unnamed protein product [Effrenium voratum]|uniref:Uncharacterized protein n=1 Tax=Effrenium voratum TaxID=2562239 RepID=A0AA36MHY5_9DINO|nr:unnamed protein product [Effrenium voratum]